MLTYLIVLKYNLRHITSLHTIHYNYLWHENGVELNILICACMHIVVECRYKDEMNRLRS